MRLNAFAIFNLYPVLKYRACMRITSPCIVAAKSVLGHSYCSTPFQACCSLEAGTYGNFIHCVSDNPMH